MKKGGLLPSFFISNVIPCYAKSHLCINNQINFRLIQRVVAVSSPELRINLILLNSSLFQGIFLQFFQSGRYCYYSFSKPDTIF